MNIHRFANRAGLVLRLLATLAVISGLLPVLTAAPVARAAASAAMNIAKSAAPEPVAAGSALTYTLTLTNLAGSGSGQNVAVTDTLPSNVQFASLSTNWGPANCVYSLALHSVLCGDPNLAHSRVVSITIVVTPTVVGVITNTATVSASNDDPLLGSKSATAMTTVLGGSDLSLSLSDSADPVSVGTPVQYTALVSNSAYSTSTTTVFTGTLSGAFTFDSASPGCGQGGGVVTCALGSLAVGASQSVTFTLIPTAPGIITVNGQVAGDLPDPVPANNLDTETTTVDLVDLAIGKTASPSAITAGDQIVYTLFITNSTALTSTGVTVVDNLPLGTTVVGASAGCVGGSGSVICTLGSLGANQSTTRQLTVTTSTALTGTITNTALVTADQSDPNPIDNTASVNVTVSGVVDLVLDKSSSPDPAFSGQPLTYTLLVTNTGALAASGVTVTDTLPSGVTLNQASGPGGACNASAGTVVCPIGALGPSASAQVTILVTPTVSGYLLNQAVTANDLGEPYTADNGDQVTTVVDPADLSLTKSDTPDPAYVGQAVLYTLTVENFGPAAATNVIVTDTLPAQAAFLSASPGCGHSLGVVNCSLGALGVTSTTFTITVSFPAGAAGLNANTAQVSADQPDLNPGNNGDSQSTTVQPLADLVLSKSAPAAVLPGALLTYTLAVTNTGASTAANVLITDSLPANVTLFSAPGGCTGTTSVVCDLGSLASGASDSRLLVVTVAPTATGTLLNRAVAGSSTADANGNDNSAQASTSVTPQADLLLTLSAAPNPVLAGETLTYTLQVTNTGPADAQQLVISHTLPSGVTFASASSGCVHAAGTVTCSPSSLAAGASLSRQVVVDVDGGTRGLISSPASVTASTGDPNGANNGASANVTVTGAVDLVLSKSAGPNPAVAGQSLVFTLTVGNQGPSLATSVTLTDNLPSGAVFFAASSGCGHAAGVVTCGFTSLASGASRLITITVVPQQATVGTMITNTAEVAATETELAPGNNTAQAAVSVIGKLYLPLILKS